MKVLFHINHPAHFHLFKNVITSLKSNGHNAIIIARNKDVLTQLLDNAKFDYINTHKSSRASNIFSLFIDQIIQFFRIKKIIRNDCPDILIGTSFILPYLSRWTNIPYINVLEDDANIVPLYARYSLSKSEYILAPFVCNLGKWEQNKLGYNSYHELAFLHPNNFTPNKETANRYINTEQDNYLIRFTAFNAHHDYGKRGISNKTTNRIIDILKTKGNIHISSETDLPKEYEKYKLSINPNDIHHVMAFCTLIIGDSQSMAMEAACLGVPSIRMNDYAHKISYLEEVEKYYRLSYSYLPKETEEFLKKIKSIISVQHSSNKYEKRAQIMIREKCDTHQLLTWLITEYPESVKTMKENPAYLERFGGHFKQQHDLELQKPKKSNFDLILSILYVFILLVFYLLPLSGALSLNRYNYLSFRGDHIIHLLVFAPLPILFTPIFLNKNKWRIVKASLFALLVALGFELSHIIVPYRSFTFEDLTANIAGVLIGILVLLLSQKWRSSK